MKTLTALLVSLASLPALSQTFPVLMCTSAADASSCSQNCKPSTSQISLAVDKGGKSVSARIFTQATSTPTMTWKGCEVYDDKNWECRQNTQIDWMFKGIYSHTLFIEDSPNAYYDMSKGTPFFCAK